MVEIRNSSRILDGKFPGKQLFGRLKTWEDIVQMDPKEIVYEDERWMELAQNHDQ
jgi:hypothetical protein